MKDKILFGKRVRSASLGRHRRRPVQCANRSFCKNKWEDMALVRRRSIRLPVGYCECGSKLQAMSTTFYRYKYSNTFSLGTLKLWFPGSRPQSYRMKFSGMLAAICMVRTKVPSSGLGLQVSGEVFVSVFATMEW